MKVISLSCDSCGAKLDVPSKANFVTCAFCETRLKIQRGETAVITESLEELSLEIKSLRQDASVARLDREWEASRERFETRHKGGAPSLPSAAGGMMSIIIGIAWAGFLLGGISQTPFGGLAEEMSFGSRGRGPSFNPVVAMGLLGGVVGVGAGLWQLSRASAYKAELAKYHARRRELIGD